MVALANRDRALTGRSILYSPCMDTMRDLLSVRSAVTAFSLTNPTTKHKGFHTIESCKFIVIRFL